MIMATGEMRCDRCLCSLQPEDEFRTLDNGDDICRDCYELLEEDWYEAHIAAFDANYRQPQHCQPVMESQQKLTVRELVPTDKPSVSALRLKAFCQLIGETEDAIRSRIKRGEWLEGDIWFKCDGEKIYIDLERYERWLRKNRRN